MGRLDKLKQMFGKQQSPIAEAKDLGVSLKTIGTTSSRREAFRDFLWFVDDISENEKFKDATKSEQEEIASEASWFLAQSEVIPFLSGAEKEKGARIAMAYIYLYSQCKKMSKALERMKGRPEYSHLKLDPSVLRNYQLKIATILYTQSWRKEHHVPDQVWIQQSMFPSMGGVGGFGGGGGGSGSMEQTMDFIRMNMFKGRKPLPGEQPQQPLQQEVNG